MTLCRLLLCAKIDVRKGENKNIFKTLVKIL